MSDDQLYEDRYLFERIAEGDENAFRKIFEFYGPRLHPFIVKVVKDDSIAREIMQEVFLKLWIHRGKLATIERPAAWLYRIASNLSINAFRKRELDRRLLKEISQDDTSTDMLEELSARELRSLIHEAVEQLPPRRKEIYLLFREQGLSRREVAKQLGISENTVKNQLAYSLQFIQQFIQNKSGYTIPFILLFLEIIFCPGVHLKDPFVFI